MAAILGAVDAPLNLSILENHIMHNRPLRSLLVAFGLFTIQFLAWPVLAQDFAPVATKLGPYEYETKPDHPAFAKFNPQKAPPAGELLLKSGDRLAICGDSITEQKMYSRIIETYLTVCTPQLGVTVRQYGWSGEKTDGFLNRMDHDCLKFNPTVATLCYGMNDTRYRPFDLTNGQWYGDHYTAIIQKFKAANVRVVVGSPGCAGKLASWVKTRVGTLDEHNLHLCSLRDVALQVARREDVAFADIFWPMYQAQILAPEKFGATEEKPYDVAGSDGIHPNWAGQTMMAFAFLKAMGLGGNIGEITFDLQSSKATATEGHTVDQTKDGVIKLTSSRYPFCAEGPLDKDSSIRSGMELVPFQAQLNRFILRVSNFGSSQRLRVTWGEASKEYTTQQLEAGVNLAAEFPSNPFLPAFNKVDKAVFEKQAYETKQVKQIFHGERGKADFEKAVAETEAERKPLADAIREAFEPVNHEIKIESVQ